MDIPAEDDDGRDVAADAFHAALVEDSAEELYEHAPCGFLSTLPNGTIVKVNQTFLTWTGYSREALVGRARFQDLLTVGGQIYYETHYGPLLQLEGEAREISVEILHKDGHKVSVLVNSVVTRDEAGRAAFIRTAVFDATSRRAYERELLLARRRAEASEARARVLAQTLQQSLLPPTLPRVPGLDVAGGYRPAGTGDEVGGDFYDLFETRGGEWVVVLGDVCGKGAEAAVLTALTRYTVRAEAMRTPQPARVLESLNDALRRQQGDRFCTIVYARVRGQPGRPHQVTVASGGHPLPLRVVREARPEPVGRFGTLIGAFDQVRVHDVDVVLQPGDALVLFSDGVTEARGAGGFFGEEGLEAVLADAVHESADVVARRLVQAVVDFQDGMPRDDIAVVVLKVTPAA